MGKILVFIYDEMADFEITFAAHILGGDLGNEMIPISYEDKLIKGKSGLNYKASRLVKEVLGEEADGLLIPGGWNGEVRPELVELIQSLNSKGKLLAAICAGPRFLAKSGVLDHTKYTTSMAEWTKQHIEMYNESDPFPRENFIMDRVVRDGNIITAQGTAFVDFAIEIADYFKAFEDEEDRKGFEKVMKGI